MKNINEDLVKENHRKIERKRHGKDRRSRARQVDMKMQKRKDRKLFKDYIGLQ